MNATITRVFILCLQSYCLFLKQPNIFLIFFNKISFFYSKSIGLPSS